jgi:hypothetical protein
MNYSLVGHSPSAGHLQGVLRSGKAYRAGAATLPLSFSDIESTRMPNRFNPCRAHHQFKHLAEPGKVLLICPTRSPPPAPKISCLARIEPRAARS